MTNYMPIWLIEFARWLGITPDNKRPNLGALLILLGVALLAMGYTPDEMTGWIGNLEGMVTKLTEFVSKLDNLTGLGIAAVGHAMTRGRNGTDLTPEEVQKIRSMLGGKPELEV